MWKQPMIMKYLIINIEYWGGVQVCIVHLDLPPVVKTLKLLVHEFVQVAPGPPTVPKSLHLSPLLL